ncbi:hypothetical protein LXL04_039517 [Taraxacum kok-saghyz]
MKSAISSKNRFLEIIDHPNQVDVAPLLFEISVLRKMTFRIEKCSTSKEQLGHFTEENCVRISTSRYEKVSFVTVVTLPHIFVFLMFDSLASFFFQVKSRKILFCYLDNIAMKTHRKNRVKKSAMILARIHHLNLMNRCVKVDSHEGTVTEADKDKDENFPSEKSDQDNMEHPSSLEVQENGVIEDITVLPSHKDMDTVHAAEQTSVPWATLVCCTLKPLGVFLIGGTLFSFLFFKRNCRCCLFFLQS